MKASVLFLLPRITSLRILTCAETNPHAMPRLEVPDQVVKDVTISNGSGTYTEYFETAFA